MNWKSKIKETAPQAVYSATQVLREEHRLMESAILAFAEIIKCLEQGAELDRRSVIELAELFPVYADHWHHSKEGFLISQMLARGRSHGEYLIRTFYEEHARIQPLLANLTKGAEEHSNSGMAEPLAGCLREVVDFYPGHMWKADHLLFPLADSILSPADEQALVEQFDSIEQMVGKGTSMQLRALVKELRPGPANSAIPGLAS